MTAKLIATLAGAKRTFCSLTFGDEVLRHAGADLSQETKALTAHLEAEGRVHASGHDIHDIMSSRTFVKGHHLVAVSKASDGQAASTHLRVAQR